MTSHNQWRARCAEVIARGEDEFDFDWAYKGNLARGDEVLLWGPGSPAARCLRYLDDARYIFRVSASQILAWMDKEGL